jgi:hypothetical protein
VRAASGDGQLGGLPWSLPEGCRCIREALERKSAHASHYKPGAVLCVLSLRDKLLLSVRETFDPVTVLGIAYDAGISQAENNDPSYRQGAEGYGRRFGAGLAGQASSQLYAVHVRQLAGESPVPT